MRQDLHYLFKKSKYNEKKVVICQIGGVDYVSAPTGYYYEPRDLISNKIIQDIFLSLEPLLFCFARRIAIGALLNAPRLQQPSIRCTLQCSQHSIFARRPAAALACGSGHYLKLACHFF